MNNYRFYEQALKTLQNNHVEHGYIVNAYNERVDGSGVCPTITTRPDGFKTAILVVVRKSNGGGRMWISILQFCVVLGRNMGNRSESYMRAMKFKRSAAI